MDSPKFTPGPWEVALGVRRTTCVRTADDHGAWICGEIDNDERHDENMANAALIAAAPGLYAALKETLAIASRSEDGDWRARAEAALAKAEGK